MVLWHVRHVRDHGICATKGTDHECVYVSVCSGEIMASTTGLEFAFTQAPASLKAVIMSMWFMTQVGRHPAMPSRDIIRLPHLGAAPRPPRVDTSRSEHILSGS